MYDLFFSREKNFFIYIKLLDLQDHRGHKWSHLSFHTYLFFLSYRFFSNLLCSFCYCTVTSWFFSFLLIDCLSRVFSLSIAIIYVWSRSHWRIYVVLDYEKHLTFLFHYEVEVCGDIQIKEMKTVIT